MLKRLKEWVQISVLTVRSLSHNSCRPSNFFVDAAFEPVYWFVDNLAGFMGQVFVIMVTLLTASVVAIWYSYLLPVILTFNSVWMSLHIVVAHWLLINIVFHYFKAVFTSPGVPPQGQPMESIGGAVVCKKCIQPKPPRTHHCSVCDKCFLKMDHHCPWMNNCIGFHNHRYFILFCIFMWLGTLYVSLTTFDLFTYHFFHPGTIFDEEKRSITKSLLHTIGLGGVLDGILDSADAHKNSVMIKDLKSQYRKHPGGWAHPHGYEHLAIIYLFLLTSAVTCALGLLNMWHVYLISRGQTSIEVYINNKERERAKKRGMGYNNPYDYGWRQNWKHLLGLYHNRSLLCVIFPSAHPPQGDGLSWPYNPKPLNYMDPNIPRRSNSTFSLKKLRKLLPF